MITLHKNHAEIVYKNSIFSFPFIIVLIISFSVVLVPLYLTLAINRNSWNQAVTTFEQPQLEFTHEFIYLSGSDTELVTCSSFPNYNIITSSFQRCGRVKFWNEDDDYNSIADTINFEVSHDTKQTSDHTDVGFLSIFLIFKAKLQKMCPIVAPAFLSIVDLPINQAGANELLLTGDVMFNQNQVLQCPRGMVQSDIDLDVTPAINRNSSNIEDYEVPNILERMKKTQSGYFTFNLRETLWRQGDPNKFTVRLRIENSRDLMIVYNKSVWQKLSTVWLHYLSILLPFAWLASKFKSYLFFTGFLSAWRIFPWSKCD